MNFDHYTDSSLITSAFSGSLIVPNHENQSLTIINQPFNGLYVEGFANRFLKDEYDWEVDCKPVRVYSRSRNAWRDDVSYFSVELTASDSLIVMDMIADGQIKRPMFLDRDGITEEDAARKLYDISSAKNISALER